MTYGLTRADRQPLSSCDRLLVISKIRKLELKHVKKAIAALGSYKLVMPDADRKSIRKWQRDADVKAALAEHLAAAAGVDKTVNPLNLRPALK